MWGGIKICGKLRKIFQENIGKCRIKSKLEQISTIFGNSICRFQLVSNIVVLEVILQL